MTLKRLAKQMQDPKKQKFQSGDLVRVFIPGHMYDGIEGVVTIELSPGIYNVEAGGDVRPIPAESLRLVRG